MRLLTICRAAVIGAALLVPLAGAVSLLTWPVALVCGRLLAFA